ncbi:hypothetical protein [Silvimonas sp.]|uniref:hypothetical protein n=1 Tax=Silvimonas sp. TaxID=2650811 RepID=UPI002850F992|nr:hypothetical protein [Silvimonas sp.]MDR3427782.1 hypothetical protein [Silvimonas sp.]
MASENEVLAAARARTEALLQEVRELPNPKRNLLTHNERELIDLCNRLAAALVAALVAELKKD